MRKTCFKLQKLPLISGAKLDHEKETLIYLLWILDVDQVIEIDNGELGIFRNSIYGTVFPQGLKAVTPTAASRNPSGTTVNLKTIHTTD